MEHEAVGEAIVVVREETAGQKRLVAYVVANGTTELSSAGLRGSLQEKLPEYMVPAAFVQLDELPLTANGKVDRRALPLPETVSAPLDGNSAAPQTPVEELLVGIWSEVLGVEQVGRDDNFFELGGHSLLATQVLARVRHAFHVELPLRAVFEAATPARLAAVVEAATGVGIAQAAGMPPVVPVSREAALPLSFAQQRLWFLDQFEPGSAAYNVPAAVRLTGNLDIPALERSLNEVVRRHEALRTTFATRDGQPVQIIAESMQLPLLVLDLSNLGIEERAQEVSRLTQAEALRPFDLSAGPLLRTTLLRLSADEHVALLTMHHIVSDGWSMSVFLREVAALYEAFLTGREPPLKALPIQYADYAVWQREWLTGEVLETQLSYWREQLAGAAPLLNLPTDHPRPLVQTYRGASELFAVPESLVEALRKLSKREGVTLFMTLLAAFKTLLYRYTNQQDILVGTGIGSRGDMETENLIGIFVNMLVLRTDLSRDPRFNELLQRVREVTLGAYAHQDIPFERLVEELHPERGMSHTPFFQVMLLLQNAPAVELGLPGLSLSLSGVETNISKYDLVIELKEEQAGISGRVEYSTDLFEAETIQRLLGHFKTLLESIAADPEQRLSALPLLTETERLQVLSEWNETDSDYPVQGAIHELFEAQVERTPDAVAVVYEGDELTYRELNRRANQLAHYLRKKGVKPESRVAICVERSLEMVVGLLGILKAGGAYVPSDPSYPKERLAFVLQDAEATLLLTQQRLVDDLPEHKAEVVLLDADREAIAAESEDQPSSHVTPDNVAYVIYTSGSTGRPKGVLGLHRGAVNRFHWMWETYPFEAGEICCQKTSLGFLDSLWEIFGTMLRGVRTVIIPDEAVKDPHLLVEKLAANQVTRIVLVPSLLRVLLDTFTDLESRVPKLKYWVTSGEALPFELFERFRQNMPGAVLLNLYGSSEISADCTWYDLSGGTPDEVVPIGKPIANTQIYLLDAHLNPVPVGIYGTLHVGGEGLARGYLDRPELTAERFIPNPFSDEPGARLYDMGDLVRWRPDHNLEYGGRTDHQVKIRGFRIELGEVEAMLGSHPQISEAVVVAREDAPGEKRLVAYAVAEPGQALDINELRDFLKEKLPEYMLPSIFMELETLPLTPSGKLNRLALPAPTGLRPSLTATYEPPQTSIEKEITTIWIELLQLEQVGVNDNFFDLGGHSLMATQVMSRVRTNFNVEVRLRDFFMKPTVRHLSVLVEEALLAKTDTARVEELMSMLEGLDDDEAQRILTLKEETR
jgi:amino acid adenylation domain-containing protein